MSHSRPPPHGAMVCAGLITAQFVAGTATRDALYFAHSGVESLPQIIIATACFSILLVAVTAKAFGHVAPPTLVPAAFAVSAAIFLGEWMIVRSEPARAAQLVYLHVSGLGPVLASGFWLIVTDRFEPRTAKQRFGQIAAGGTLGGIAGGLLAERVASLLGVSAMLPVLAVLSAVCAVQIYRLPRESGQPEGARALELSPDLAPDAPRSGLRVLASTPHLRHLAALVLLTTTAAVLLDYVFKAHAVAAFGRGEALLRFFAAYYAVVNLITFVVQASSSRLVLERFGLTAAAAMPSAAAILGGCGALLAPGLPSALLARGGQAVLRGSVFRSGYEVFYTPVASTDKRAAKSIIDVGFDKVGDAAGAGVVRVAQSLVFASHFTAVLLAAVVCSGLALAVSTRLRRGYVQSLEKSLKARAIELDLTQVYDPLTREIALRTQAADVTLSAPSPTVAPAPRSAPELLAIIALRSRDRARIVRVLQAGDGIAAPLVAHVIGLLAWDAVAEDAIVALRAIAGARVGQLTDALLDQEQPFAIRRRIARVLSACETQRAVEGLMLGLDDPRFEVRFHCGRSLAAITGTHAGLYVESSRAFAIVLREATVSRHLWESRQLLDELVDSEPELFDAALVKNRATQSLAHVFTVLSLVLSREPLRIAFRGLQTEDERLRGTALEYLEHVLPPEIHQRLAPFLDASRPGAGTRRSRDAVLAELFAANKSMLSNLTDWKLPRATSRLDAAS